ncbi:MAG: hypothetical protein JNK85_18570 [Verrucomicrobiales bacterium]|nr:hypothetical protein [Verrucomicrobiales bacterium]
MSRVLTVRIEPDLLSRAEARAARLGLDRAGYVRELIRHDLENAADTSQRQFASEDLVGKYQLGGQSATNEKARGQLRKSASSRRETHR